MFSDAPPHERWEKKQSRDISPVFCLGWRGPRTEICHRTKLHTRRWYSRDVTTGFRGVQINPRVVLSMSQVVAVA